MNKKFLSLALALGAFATIQSTPISAYAGGGTLNPDPPRGNDCHTAWASDGSTSEVCTGGGHSHRGGSSAPTVGRETPPVTSFACAAAISAKVEFPGEGRVEVLATIDHASTHVGSPTTCLYNVDLLKVNGRDAQAVEALELEPQGRIFLSLVTAKGEKVRLVASNSRVLYGEPPTASFFVVPGFRPEDLYQPLRFADSNDVELIISNSATVVPVQN